MKRRIFVVVAGLLSTFLAANVPAQTAVWESERILIPLFTDSPIEGALGSRWTTELSVMVGGSEAALIAGYEFQPCQVNPCAPPQVPPGLTFYPSLGATTLHGAYLWVDAALAKQVHANLRARDLSRQESDWGAEVPTVREAEAPVGTFELVDIPADQGYRVLLRAYHFGEGNTAGSLPVTVRVFEVKPDQHVANDQIPGDSLVTELPLDLAGGSYAVPGYGEIPDLTASAPVRSGRYRIEVSGPSEARIWGFVTITNNATQHFTVVSPQ